MAEAIEDAAPQTTGPSPAEALAGALEDRTETLGLAASEALVKMGPSATGVLAAALKSENPEVRRLSSEALATIGSPSVDPLLEAFRSEDELLRETAAETLTALDETSVTALAKALPEADAEGQRRMSDLLTAIGSPSAVQVLVDALRDWRTRQAAARALDEAGWEPDTPEDRVHLWVAQGRRKALMDQWRITRYVLSKDLTSGSRRETEYAVRAWIALGNEESVPEMLEYLEEAENQQIALMFYQSGNPRLAQPAEKWFREQQLDPEAMLPILAGDTPAVRWGSMGQPQ
jgi:HEAT repeat protein